MVGGKIDQQDEQLIATTLKPKLPSAERINHNPWMKYDNAQRLQAKTKKAGQTGRPVKNSYNGNGNGSEGCAGGVRGAFQLVYPTALE